MFKPFTGGAVARIKPGLLATDPRHDEAAHTFERRVAQLTARAGGEQGKEMAGDMRDPLPLGEQSIPFCLGILVVRHIFGILSFGLRNTNHLGLFR